MKWASLKRSGKKEQPRKLRTEASSSTKIHHQSTKLDSSPKGPPNAFTTSATPQPRSRSRSSSSTAARNKNGTRLNDVAQEAIVDAASLARQVKEGNPSNSNNAGNSTHPPSVPRTLSMAPQLQSKGGKTSNPNNTGTGHATNAIGSGAHPSTSPSLNNNGPWDNMVKEAISAAGATAGSNRFEDDPAVVQRRRSAVEFKQSGSSRRVASPGRGSSRDSIRRNKNQAHESNLRPSKYTTTNGNSNKAPNDDGDYDDDDASWSSHESQTSYSTSFSFTYNKLKGMIRSRSLSRTPKAGLGLKNRNRKPQRSASERPRNHAPGKMTQKHRRSNKPATGTQGTHVSSSHSSVTTSNSFSVSPISQRGGISNEVNQSSCTTTTISLNDVKKVEEEEHLDADVPTPASSAYNGVTVDECSETLTPSLIEPLAMRHQAPADYASAYGVATGDSSTENGRRGDYPNSVCGSLMDNASVGASAFLSAAATEYSDMDRSSVCPSVNKSNDISVITNTPAEYLIINPNDGSSTVLDLPWVDDSSGKQLQGVYSGPVAIVPHGKGKLVVTDGGKSLAFTGHWKHGELVTPLRENDEGGSAMLPDIVQQASGRSIGNPTHNDNHKKKKKKKKSSSRKNPNTKEYYANLAKEVGQTSLPKSMATTSKDGTSLDDSSARSRSRSRSNSLQSRTKTKYTLGAIARSPHDMIIHRSNEEAIQSASLLKKYDQAFLRRSNGVWTCAVLADRTAQPTNAPSTRAHWHTEAEIDAESMNLEECMLFVINEDGATKIVKKRHWGKFVRRHAAEGDEDQPRQ